MSVLYKIFKVSSGTNDLHNRNAPIPFDTFLEIASICSFQSSFSSIMTPKLLFFRTRCIFFSQIEIMGSFLIFARLCREPIIINSVLVVFSVNLFATSQLPTLFISEFNSSLI